MQHDPVANTRAPILRQVADALWSRAVGGEWDLSNLIVVTPGARASRVLLAMLAFDASSRRVCLSPPRTITPGALAATLLRDAGAWPGAAGTIGTLAAADHANEGGLLEASPVLARAAWIAALREADEATRVALSPTLATPHQAADLTRALAAIAGLLERSSHDLAAEGLLFADAAARVGDSTLRLRDFSDIIGADHFGTQSTGDADGASLASSTSSLETRLLAAASVQAAYVRALARVDAFDPTLHVVHALRSMRGVDPTPHEPDVSHQTPLNDANVLLIATIDLPGVARDALRLTRARWHTMPIPGASPSDRVVSGTARRAWSIDGFGCARPEPSIAHGARTRATTTRVPQRPHAASLVWEIVNDDAEQARAAVAHLRVLLPSNADPSAAIVGVLEPAVTPHLDRAARAVGLRVRTAGRVTLGLSEPYRITTSLIAHARHRTVGTLRALLLRPRVERWLDGKTRADAPASEGRPVRVSSLAALDRYTRAVVHASLDVPFRATGSTADTLDMLRDRADALTRPLATARTAHAAAFALLGALHHVHTDARGASGSAGGRASAAREANAAAMIADGLRTVAASSSDLLSNLEPLEALEASLAVLRDQPLPDDADASSIEGLGWLDVLLDPSASVVITGMTAQQLPSRPAPDPLLPNSLRRGLGLDHAERREARDRFLFRALLASKAHVRAIVPRTDREGAPTLPSPLLDTDDSSGETPGEHSGVVELLRAWSSPDAPQRGPAPPGDAARAPDPAIAQASTAARDARVDPVAPFAPAQPLSTLSPARDAITINHVAATSLRDYVASPYLFYLRHVLGLREISDELAASRGARVGIIDGLALGSLVHRTLEILGEDSLRDATDPRALADALRDTFSSVAAQAVATLDEHASPRHALSSLQVHAIHARLAWAAGAQAKLRREGWRVVHVEATLPEGLQFDPSDVPVVRATIDRIDAHEATGRLRVIDYKCGDSPKSPTDTHGGPGEWRDFQLPIYRHVARTLHLGTPRALADCASADLDAPVELAYFAVCADEGRVGAHLAPWTSADLADADEAARRVLVGIRNRDFAPRDGEAISTHNASQHSALFALATLASPPTPIGGRV